MRYDAEKVRYMRVRVRGTEALFCEARIEKETVPNGLYMYQVRHDEEDWTEPVQIKSYILVNFLGTLLTREPLLSENEQSSYLDSEKEWEVISERSELGVAQFMSKCK